MLRFVLSIFLLLNLLSCEEVINNNPPSQPLNIIPINNDTIINYQLYLEWYSVDIEDDLTYDLYLGNNPNPSLFQSNIDKENIEITLEQSDEYWWYVIAKDGTNEVKGKDSRFIFINPESLPKIDNITLQASKKETATVETNIINDGGSDIIQRGFIWSRYENPQKIDSIITINDSSLNFAAEINYLYDGTKYFIKAFATNGFGTSYSDQFSFTSWDDNENQGTFVDRRDNSIYEYIRIGTQKWMKTNLAYLPKVYGPEFSSNTEPFYYVQAYFGSDIQEVKRTDNYKTYGVMYNWPAAIQNDIIGSWKLQGVCPDGWHLPSDEEWDILTEYTGGRYNAGGNLKATGTELWDEPNAGATNEYGFSALPGGAKSGIGKTFNNEGARGYWWSATEYDEAYAKRRYMYYEYAVMGNFQLGKDTGLSVRCIKD